MLEGSIPALVTPFQKDGLLDVEKFQELVEWHIECESDGIVIGGTTGESPTLTDEEFDVLLSTAVSLCKGKLPIIVGSGTNSTASTVAKTMRAKEIGADYAMVITPYYNKPMEKGLRQHYKLVCEQGLPVIVYHHPGRCGIKLDSEFLVELSGWENVAAIKDASCDLKYVRELLNLGLKAPLLCGEDTMLLEYLELGAKGTISVVANAMPSRWKEIIQYWNKGDEALAGDLFEDMRTLLWAMFLETNPMGIKCVLSKQKMCENILRLPLTPVCRETEEEITSALESLEEALV